MDDGAAETVIAVVAGKEEHPFEVTVRLAVLEPAVDQFTDTGPAVADVNGLAKAPKLQLYVVPAGCAAEVAKDVDCPIQTVAGVAKIETTGKGFTEID